jgi:hypothetical protein
MNSNAWWKISRNMNRLGLIIGFACPISACAPQPIQIVVIPTLASLPTETPTFESSALTSPTSPAASDTLLATLFQTVIIVPTNTPIPTNTLIDTLLPEVTTQATAEIDPHMATVYKQVTHINETAYAIASQTAILTATAEAQLTSNPLIVVDSQGYYTRQRVSLYECPNTECASLAQLETNTFVWVDGFVEGESVEVGNAIWFRTQFDQLEGYVYSNYVIPAPPGATGEEIPISFPTVPISVAPPPNPSGGICPSTTATCGQLTTCEQAYACLAAGIRRLDNDGDGIPCESICLP